MNDPLAVGRRLIELIDARQTMRALDELYADDIVSVEPVEHPGMPRVIEGIDAVRDKNRTWLASGELHEMKLSGPFPHQDRFAVFFEYEVTPKQLGERIKVQQVGIYTVRDGKITREEFFYNTG